MEKMQLWIIIPVINTMNVNRVAAIKDFVKLDMIELMKRNKIKWGL